MKDIKLFDATFKLLTAVTVCAWALYLAFLVFLGDTAGCAASPASQLFDALAWAAGILTAPPLVYGLVHMFLWPDGQKKDAPTWLAVWIVGWGIGIFVIAAVLLAIALSQYGCK